MPQMEWLLSLHALISGTGFSKLPGETHPLWTLQRPVQQKTPRVGSGGSNCAESFMMKAYYLKLSSGALCFHKNCCSDLCAGCALGIWKVNNFDILVCKELLIFLKAKAAFIVGAYK